MAIVVTAKARSKLSNLSVVLADLAFDSSYPAGGESLTPEKLGLSQILGAYPENPGEGGYIIGYDVANEKAQVFAPLAAHTHGVLLDGGASAAEAAHTHGVLLDGGASAAEAAHTHGVLLDGGASAAGVSHNHAFTGTDPVGSLNLATPAFSGTGLTAAGQVMTTTDNQTMTLNQCAGMWLIPATGATPPMLILSNTAVTGAPAVLTVQGAAATDAGAYKIVKSLAPVGTNAAEATHTHGPGTLADAASAAGSSHTHGPGTLADAASAAGSSHTHGPGTLADAASAASTEAVGSEVDASTDLSALTAVGFLFIGR